MRHSVIHGLIRADVLNQLVHSCMLANIIINITTFKHSADSVMRNMNTAVLNTFIVEHDRDLISLKKKKSWNTRSEYKQQGAEYRMTTSMMFIALLQMFSSSGAGVFQQWGHSADSCGAGVVGEIFRETRFFSFVQESCCVTAGHGCTVRIPHHRP